ncbi:MAG TPA: hypothetical protein VF458_07285, partial [Ktedonobacteraceae bacterium]
MEQQLVFPRLRIENARKRLGILRTIHIPSVFFAIDRSPDNRQIIDIQRRACWIGLALVLQAINEALNQLDWRWNPPFNLFMRTWGGTLAFGLILASFFVMWMAFRPTTLRSQTRRVANHPYLWQRIVLVLVLITTLAGVIEFGRGVYMGFFAAPQYTNDGTSLDTNAAIELLQGHDPYADADISRIARMFKIDPTWTTPLRLGQFANRLVYPTPADLRTVLDTDNKSGSPVEFEARVSYPSLSFLTLVPFIWLGIYNVLPLYLFSYIGLVALGWQVVRKELRPWVIVFSLANVSMWSSVVGGNLDVVMIVFLVLAWLGRERRWLSALALGVAIGCKQPAWFFVPFYVILMFRTRGWREALYRLAIASSLFMALNLPFILWNPQAWMTGVMAPINDPMFPMGVGIVGLVGSPFLHTYMSSMVYSLLEYIVFYPLCMAWYWRLCKVRPEAAMLLAVLPLFFAWRSLPSYFACAAFPMFILMASRGNTSKGSQPRNTPILQGPAHSEPVEARAGKVELLVE